MSSINKTVSLLLKITGGFIALVVLALVIILVTVDPNDYREEITSAVKEQTGRDFEVGNMSLSIFPELAINLENTTLSNAKGFNNQAFFEAEKIQVGAAIMPLLTKNLEVETLTLYGLKLNLEKDAQGKTNWDDLVKNKDNDQEAEKPQTSSDNDALEQLSSLNFGGIDIQDAQMTWSDKQNQQNITLSELDVTTGSITFGEFFDVYIAANTTINKPQITSKLKLNLQAKLEKSGLYELKNLVLNNTTSGKGLPVEQAITTIELPSFSLNNNQLSVANLAITYAINGGKDFVLSQTNGDLKITGLSGDLEKQNFKAENINLTSELSGDIIPMATTAVNLSTAVALDLKKQTAVLNNAQIKAEGVNINANLKATQIIDNPTANANIEMAPTNLRALLQKLKVTLPEMADSNTLKKVALKTNMAFNQKAQSLELTNLKLSLDDTNLTGNTSVKNFSSPAISYNLNLDKIDLNRYLPAKTQTAEQTTTNTDTDAKISLPTEMLRKLNVNGSFKAGSVIYDNLKPSNIVLTTKAKNGVLNANPIQATLFKTQINASAGLNVSGKTPQYSFTTNTKNLPIGEALLAITGKDQITGTGTVNVDITTRGERVSEFKKGLNGKVSANIENGAIKGFNLAKIIRETKAKLSGTKLKADKVEQQTDFSALNAKATIKNGVITTQELSAKAPFMRVDGSGSINLPKASLNYLVKAKIVDSDKGQGGQELKELNGLTIPVKLTGSYLSPDIGLDMGSLVEQKTKAKIEEKKKAIVDDIKKKTEDKLKDSLLKNFKF